MHPCPAACCPAQCRCTSILLRDRLLSSTRPLLAPMLPLCCASVLAVGQQVATYTSVVRHAACLNLRHRTLAVVFFVGFLVAGFTAFRAGGDQQ